MRYFVLSPTYIKHAAVTSETMTAIGDIIDIDVIPGAALIAVDAAAVAAKAKRVLARSGVAEHEERLERRLRAELPKALRAKLETLEAKLPESVADACERLRKKEHG